MFQNRVIQLLDTLHTSNKELAEYAGCTPSSISRLRSGVRKPRPTGPTIDKLIRDTTAYAANNNMLAAVCELVGATEQTNLDDAIRQWLFAEEPEAAIHGKTSQSHADPSRHTFGDKLNKSMLLADLSNSKLSRLVNTDPSLISRYRSGLRTPKSNPELFEQICMVVFHQITIAGQTDKLAAMIGIPDDDIPMPSDILYQHFHSWLYDFKSSDYMAIHHLLNTIETMTLPVQDTEPLLADERLSHTLPNTENCYYGFEGLQNAVLRFLQTVIQNGGKELLLYSDQNMDWMTVNPQFHLLWAQLMSACTNNSICIHIIHHIDRDLTEMIQGIEAWMPLYMSGRIHSYYCNRKIGSRFSHTYFLCPGIACIEACHVYGTEENGAYHYYTDPQSLDFYHLQMTSLMKECSPLVRMDRELPQTILCNRQQESIAKEAPQTEYLNSIRIQVSPTSVMVTRINEPCITFTFLHPMMCGAFDRFMKRKESLIQMP